MAEEIIESSVQRKPTHSESASVVLHMPSVYDRQVPKWWSPQRDTFFRDFWLQESILASAIYSIAARNAAFGWDLSGLSDDVARAQRLLQFADFGGGWQQLITKTTIDTLTCDNGAFWEVIRPSKVRVNIDGINLTLPAVKQYYESNEKPEWFALHPDHRKIRLRDRDYKLFDTPLDLPISIAHLDSGRCRRTGDPEVPVIYQDIEGKLHKLMWWQVLAFSDMPSPIEDMNGVGFCALSRIFRHAHTLQSLSVYKDEKLSGQFTRAVHITNADPGLIQDQIQQAQDAANNIGLQRYGQPVIASTFDPSATPQVTTIDLASMPDNFEESTTLEWYVSVLALALGVDYGFLAPLPGKGLGTAAQSETMERQSRGKSSRLFMDMTSNAINFRGILPESVRFRYIERDTAQEKAQEEVKHLRAQTRQMMIASGEISPQIARQIAADDGDLRQKYLDVMGEANLTPGVEIGGDENLAAVQVEQEAAQTAGSLVMGTEPTATPDTTPTTEPNSTLLAKGFSFDEKAIQARRAHLFGTHTLAQKISNATHQVFGKKQAQDLKDPLDTYGSELVEIALDANEGRLTADAFADALVELAALTLVAVFAQGYGSDAFEIPDELVEMIQAHREAAANFGADLERGRYHENEDGLRRRISLWTEGARYAYNLGMVSNPTAQDRHLMFVMGPTSDHCEDCVRLNQQVHTAEEWRAHARLLPQSGGLACGGYRCTCRLNPTDEAVNGEF